MSYYQKEDDIVNDFGMVWDVIRKNHFNLSEDLFQIGCIGLLKASRKFDASKNFKFSTLAHVCIKNEILMHLRQPKKHCCTFLISYDFYLENSYYSEINNSQLYYEDIYCFKSFEEIIREAISLVCTCKEEQDIFYYYYNKKLKGEPIARMTIAKKYNIPVMRISKYIVYINEEIKQLLVKNTCY